MDKIIFDHDVELVSELDALRREVMELRIAEKARRASEAHYRNLVETAPLAIALVDAQGRILLVNTRTEALFGYRRAELIGQTVESLIPGMSPGVHAEMLYDVPGRRKDGATFPVEIKLGFIDTEYGTVTACFISDITERKQIEQERDRYIEELSAFSHTVAHDLTAPLGVVVGYVDLLKEDFHSLSDEQIEQCLYALAKHGHKMSNIIDELLLVVEDKREAPRRPLDMRSIAESARRRLEYLIHECNAQVTLADDWPAALGHAPWIEEVWVNYLSNAIKYGGQPPCVEMGAGRQGGDKVHFWVRDNGGGVAAGDREKLFEALTQSNEQRIDGHGLGLSIVKRIVHKLGGEVGAESAGAGSLFWFTLPAAAGGQADKTL
ncbi:MAG: PAS domain-containing sensor histidine kinase [Anaerolineae bacterium]|nr:PAS domain-containing sensor histidine kinase [Anaerolineae bacterium]